MIKAIVYLSNTGFTKAYAHMLSAETGLDAYTFKEAVEKLEMGDKVFYMGWILGGRIKGYTKAALMYNVVGLCGVGMNFKSESTEKLLREACGVYSPRVKVFYAQAGFYPDRLQNGVHTFMMRSAYRSLKNSSKANPHKSEMLAMMEKGGDYSSKEKIQPVIDWINLYNRHAASVEEKDK